MTRKIDVLSQNNTGQLAHFLLNCLKHTPVSLQLSNLYMYSKSKSKLTKLTTKWYERLKKSGFEDIEWYDKDTGKGQNTRYLKDHAQSKARSYKPETAQFYRIMRNFAQHYDFPRVRDRFIMNLYAEGYTFRDIVKKCIDKGTNYGYNSKGRKNISLFRLHHMIKHYILEAKRFNVEHPEGLDYQSASTEIADELSNYIDDSVKDPQKV